MSTHVRHQWCEGASKNVVFKQLRLQGIYSPFISKEFRCFKNGFNFKYISSYKNWFKQRFKDINLTEPMIWYKSPSSPTPVRTPNLHDAHRSALLPSHCDHLCSGLCFLFALLCSCWGHGAQCCVSTQQCRSVSSIYLRVDGLAHGNTGTLQCILLHTKVTALVEWHKDHKVTQHQSKIIHKTAYRESMCCFSGELKAMWKKIYPHHHNKQYVERSKCFTCN